MLYTTYMMVKHTIITVSLRAINGRIQYLQLTKYFVDQLSRQAVVWGGKGMLNGL